MAETVDSDSGEAGHSPSPSAYTTPPETPMRSPSMSSPTSGFLGLIQSEMNSPGALEFPVDLINLPSPPQPKLMDLPSTPPAFSPYIRNSSPVHIMLFEPNSALVRKAPGLLGIRTKAVHPSMKPTDLSFIATLGEKARSTYKYLRQAIVEVTSVVM